MGMRKRVRGLTGLAFVMAAAVTPALQADSLANLIAINGSITQGELVFSAFQTSPATAATTVDVAGFSFGGDSGLRVTPIPAGTRFSATTLGGGGGARELVVDVTFTVSSSVPIHAVRQGIDPATAATGNAIVRNLTSFLTGPTNLALFNCVQGNGLPSGQNCPSPVDVVILSQDISSLTIDRQIQIVVGQKAGLSGAGDGSAAFFDITFVQAQAPRRRRAVSH
jgi:hypothetical protein